MSAEPVREIAQEDAARADLYALLSRLYYAAPDRPLLAAIADPGALPNQARETELVSAWEELRRAAAAADADRVRAEYDEVFVGTGKARVTPYVSFYIAETGREFIVPRLRHDLAELGLARHAGAREPEDHVAGVLDVMRHLVLAGSDDGALHKQSQFFGRFIEPCYEGFCGAVLAARGVEFYRPIAVLTRQFLRVESQAMKLA